MKVNVTSSIQRYVQGFAVDVPFGGCVSILIRNQGATDLLINEAVRLAVGETYSASVQDEATSRLTGSLSFKPNAATAANIDLAVIRYFAQVEQ